MKQIEAYRAQGVAGPPPEDLIISFKDITPDFSTLEEAAEFHTKHADVLLAALVHTIPGGTLDRLLGKLLAYRSSLFLVAFEKEK